MIDRLVEWYDWKIYWLAHKSLNRMVRRSPGMAYYLELWLRKWRDEQRLSESLTRSTEVFFQAQCEAIERIKEPRDE